jgi:hypothetical protein
MKRFALTFLFGLTYSLAAYAQGPMPTCIAEALNATRPLAEGDLADHKIENVENIVFEQSENQIGWEITYQGSRNSASVRYDVYLNKWGCQVDDLRSVSSIYSSPVEGRVSLPSLM